jgi:hypothetical protein
VGPLLVQALALRGQFLLGPALLAQQFALLAGPLHLPLRGGVRAHGRRHLLPLAPLRLLRLVVELREEATSCHRISW